MGISLTILAIVTVRKLKKKKVFYREANMFFLGCHHDWICTFVAKPEAADSSYAQGLADFPILFVIILPNVLDNYPGPATNGDESV